MLSTSPRLPGDCFGQMEKDLFESWSHHQHSNRQSFNLNSSCGPFDLGKRDSILAYMKTPTIKDSTNGTSPLPGLPLSKETQLNEPHNWFYCLPRFRQGFTHMENTIKEITTGQNENQPTTGSGCAQKKFLVFDQSGDQTTLIFNSGIGTRDQFLNNAWMPKPLSAHALNRGNPNNENVTVHHSGENLTNEYEDDVDDEMREDTEELDALLYSDDENDFSDDDEVTSTGHSPIIMTAYDKQRLSEESEEEVASSSESNKRQKLFDVGYDVLPSLTDTASSLKPDRCSEYEDDAESSCGDVKNHRFEDFDFLSGEKRLMKDKIREKVSIIKSIVPIGKGNDVIGVLDEAIGYLRYLKRKAKALGLDSL